MAYSSGDGVLFNKAKTILIVCPGGKSGEYVIPESGTSIGDSDDVDFGNSNLGLNSFFDNGGLDKDTEPSDVVRIWNDALFDGDIELARMYTSATSSEYIRNTWGSLEGLVQVYQNAINNRCRCVTDHQTIEGRTARVAYTCFYPDNSIKQWEDTLFFEEGIWKVAPQFARATNL